MREDGLKLDCRALTAAEFLGFRGNEQISRPYEFLLFFTVPVGTDVRKAVGERATVHASRRGGAPLVVHGVLAGVRLLHQTGERSLYQALLVPKLWLLRHFMKSFVFTHQNLKAFLTATLESGGLLQSDFRFSIDDDTYVEEEFVVQYRETNLAFFHRWLEREGLYYYFEHPEDKTHEVLVIVDNRGLHDDFPGGGSARYFPTSGEDASAPAGIHHLDQEIQWLPKTVSITDSNYANPAAPVEGESSVTAHGLGTITEHGYRVFVQGDATRLAEVRAQSIGCREVTLRASGNLVGPRAGYRLSLEDHPDDVVAGWLAIEVEHAGSITGIAADTARLTGLSERHPYRMKLVAIPSSIQFRAAQSTPLPRIYGFENATVCGPADSQYAQIDADGRYLVRFDFDSSDLPDAKVSTRVRMMQPHGGSNEGFHFPLRKGTEVMIAFVGGDPDRPFIAGVVPNAHRPSVVGERNASQNVIRTGSGNQLVLEDEQGKEFIFLNTPNNRTGIYMGHPSGSHAAVYTGDGETEHGTFLAPSNANPAVAGGATVDVEFTYLQTTAGNGGVWTGGDFWENVSGNKSSLVCGNLAAGVSLAYTLEIGQAAEETYYATRKTTIKTGREDKVEAGGMTQDIHGGFTQTIEPEGSQTVTGTYKHDVSDENFDNYGSWKTEVAKTWKGHFTGDVELKSDTSFKITAPQAKVSASDYKIHVLGLTFDYSPAKHEVYLYKGASGVAKTDHSVFSQAACGLKLDTTGIKIDFYGMDKKAVGVRMEQLGAFVKQQATAAIVAGLISYSAAVTKL